jgi:hypothetical protein
VTLARRLRDLAPGLTPRAVLEKFAAVADDRRASAHQRRAQVVMSRYTQPEPELKLLLKPTQTRIARASAATNHRFRTRSLKPL